MHFHTPKGHAQGHPFVRQLFLKWKSQEMSGEKKKKDDKFFFFYVPIRSHVCSFAVLSLWIMFAGGPVPFGTAVATAGEIAFACADPFETAPGVVGMAELPLM